jgi:anti-sigma B factor antagonist
MTDTISIQTQTLNENCVVVALTGRFDAGNAEMVKTAFQQVINNGGRRVVVDLSQVPFIDSAGLAVLVSALKQARASAGNVVLAGVQPQTRNVFALTMLDQVFGIHPTIQAAVDSQD